MLNQINVLVTSGNISIVNSVHFSILYIVTLYNFRCITSDYGSGYADTTLKCQPQNKETMMSTTLGFPIGKRVSDHWSILVPEAVGFSKELLPPFA